MADGISESVGNIQAADYNQGTSHYGMETGATNPSSADPLATATAGHYPAAGEEAAATENGPAVPSEGESREVSEEEKLWTLISANPGDFQAWVNLIQEAEKTPDHAEKLRLVYDSFLAEFPLCYGYWKKYTDHETRFNDPGRVEEVFERAVIAVAYSVDMWMYYAVYKSKTAIEDEEARNLFERGLAYVGSDYLAHILWDKYLEFEATKGEWARVAQIYTRILQTPLQQLDRYWRDFKAFVSSHTLHEILTPDEMAVVSANLTNPEPVTGLSGEAMETDGAEVAGLTADVAEGLPAPPEAESSAQGVLSESGGAGNGPKTEAQHMEDYVALREAYFNASKDRDLKIREFELQVKRPYFHVKPLDEAQLSLWHRYLDFIEKEDDLSSTVKLYERCVIPTAMYPEYWIRYVTKLEALGSLDRASEALERATGIFVKRRPEIHLFAARYKEQQGDVAGARDSFNLLLQITPDLVEALVRYVNFEHRQDNLEGAEKLFESVIEQERSKEASQNLPHYYLHYGRFISQVLGSIERGRALYSTAVAVCPDSKNVWEALISFETLHGGHDRIQRLKSVLLSLLNSAAEGRTLQWADKEDVATMAREMIDLFGTVEDCREVDALIRANFLPRRSAESRKRPSSDDPYERAAKQSKTGEYVANGQWTAQQGAYPASAYAGWPQAPAAAPPSAATAATAGTTPAAAQAWAAYPAQPAAQAYAGYSGYSYGSAGTGQQAAYSAAGYTPAPYSAAAPTTAQAYGQAGYDATAGGAAAQASYYPSSAVPATAGGTQAAAAQAQQGYYAQ